jgi:hypothetical protein
VVAIHEAGHAVGQYLTAADTGYATEEAIDRIDIGLRYASREHDGVTFMSQATTYGPMLSRKLAELVCREMQGDVPLVEVARVIAQASSESVDVSKWLRSRLLYILLGPAAEAKHSGKCITDVWESYECESDMVDALKSCHLAGIVEIEDICAHINEAKITAASTVEEPSIWRAILALADALPSSGQFSGKRAAKIICSAITGIK